MVIGSCNCKSISFEVTGDIKKVVNCHCNQCRGMNGSSFSTYAVVLQSEFNLLSGELVSYGVTDNATKYFCGKCGTPIYNTNPKYAGLNMIHFGTLEPCHDVKPDVNIYSESKIDWLAEIVDLPTFEQGMR